MIGIIFSLIAGALIAFQTVFNARVSEHVGLWETTTIVHAVGFIFSLLMLVTLGEGHISKWGEINKLYLLGGAFGVIVIYSLTRGILQLGTALAVAILIITQLSVALLIDGFGLFGSAKLAIDWTKPFGIAIMILGIIVFKLKG
ncbi:MAG: DMT family transporter [Clostridiales bacterium]|nr:DMT family transporter [Clostridiales bacterium]